MRTPPPRSRLYRHLDLEAIKLHREQTGLGLAEAKLVIERIRPTG